MEVILPVLFFQLDFLVELFILSRLCKKGNVVILVSVNDAFVEYL